MPEHDDAFLETTIGKVVRAWRQHRGLSITELAARAGSPITKGYVSQLERDKIRTPGNEKLGQLARALEISVRDIVNRVMPPPLYGSPVSLGNSSALIGPRVTIETSPALKTATLDDFERELGQIVVNANLRTRQARLARQMLLEMARVICRVMARETTQ